MYVYVCVDETGHLPKARFRRHAPRERRRRRPWRCRGGAMWTVASWLGTYISLTGQSSTSALRHPTASCVTRDGTRPRDRESCSRLFFHQLPLRVFTARCLRQQQEAYAAERTHTSTQTHVSQPAGSPKDTSFLLLRLQP